MLFNKIDLPLSIPVFEALFPENCIFRIIINLKVDQSVHAVLLCETVDELVLMLINTPDKITGDSNVKGAAHFAGQDIDAKLLFFHFSAFVFPGSSHARG